jgi:hypothetical protein
LVLHLLSRVFRGFGLFPDLLRIEIKTNFILDISLFNDKRRVVGSLSRLWETGHYLPFMLIALFGIPVPVLKALMIFRMLLASNTTPNWYRILPPIGKWRRPMCLPSAFLSHLLEQVPCRIPALPWKQVFISLPAMCF